MKRPTLDPIRTHQREAIAMRRAGKNTYCACGENRIAAIPAGSSFCAACKRSMKGYKTMDKHHVAGISNSPVTVPIPVNDHRAILSECQREWPKTTLENPTGCPLLKAAGCIRGFIDTLIYLIDQMLRWIAEMLEILSALLVEELGEGWWRSTSLTQFDKRGNSK